MMKSLLATVTLIIFGIAASSPAAADAEAFGGEPTIDEERFAAGAENLAAGAGELTRSELQLALRDLWTGHIFWVRSVVLASHYDDAGAAEASEAKAVENARAIADAVIPFYGEEAADQLFELLAGHYGAVKEYMQASFDGNASGKEAATQQLVANAEEIADFLDAANPHLPKNAVLPLLSAHGGHHIQQIDAVRQGAFADEAEVWDAMLGHVYTIADAMADAFAQQFPDQVSG